MDTDILLGAHISALYYIWCGFLSSRRLLLAGVPALVRHYFR